MDWIRTNGWCRTLLLCVTATLWTPVAPAAAQHPPNDSALQPGDAVRLSIWREPELSGDFSVDRDGIVTLPRFGPMRVTDIPVAELRAHLIAVFSSYLSHESIEVTALRRIQIIGAVRNPGLFTVDPTIKVTDALALAGGITDRGKTSRVFLIRDGKRAGVESMHAALIDGMSLQSGDQIYVPERSWFARNPGIMAGALTALASIIAVIR